MDDVFKNIIDDTDEDDYSSIPIENPNSECYKCEAGMCSICKGEQYDYSVDMHMWDDYE